MATHFIIPLHEIKANASTILRQALLPLYSETTMDDLVTDFFDVCIHYASNLIVHVDDPWAQSQIINPYSAGSIEMFPYINDMYIDELSDYVIEQEGVSWFADNGNDMLHLAYNIACACIWVIDMLVKAMVHYWSFSEEGGYYLRQTCHPHRLYVETFMIQLMPHHTDAICNIEYQDYDHVHTYPHVDTASL